MNILFIHQNFPGQYKHLAPELARRGHKCVALTLRVKEAMNWNGVRILPYALDIPYDTAQTHPWLQSTNSQLIRAHSFYKAAMQLRERGFVPDVILAHPGWGESLFVKDVWPNARLGLYCELYYEPDPETDATNPEEVLRLRIRNLNNHMHFAIADAAVSPTAFQANSFPPEFRDKIEVIHDGIRTDLAVKNDAASIEIDGGRVLTRHDEVITFANRNLEPYRGYMIFMKALPELLRRRPKAQVLIVGGDETSYGAKPPKNQTWKQIGIETVRAQIPDEDWARVHFLGRMPYDRFLQFLQVSRVHVYLTYPFVLSWSFLEAMSAEAAIVASRTEPVEEVMANGQTGRLVEFTDVDALVDQVCELLDDPEQRARLGAAARAQMVAEFDLRTTALPRLLDWVQELADMPPNPPSFVAR